MSCIRRCTVLLLAFLTVMYVFAPLASAQWKPNGAPIVMAPGGRTEVTQISDGYGGMYVAWSEDRQNGNNSDVYVQHMEANGYPLWTLNGISVQPTADEQTSPAIADDGAGGVIVVWSDTRNGSFDIYAQRYDDSGTSLWTPGGVLVCNAADMQYKSAVASDGFGGAIMVWEDYRYGFPDVDIYTNRIDASGTLTFSTSGLSVCGATGLQGPAKIVSDGTGGAIFAWSDYRNGASSDVYAQRIDASNSFVWAGNGMLICAAAFEQDIDDMIADGVGGAIIAWADARLGTEFDIYVQRVNASGTVLWTADGVKICGASGNQQSACLAPDFSGGAVIAWRDPRNGGFGIYVDYINDLGTTLWHGDGLPVAEIGGGLIQLAPAIANIGDGFVLVWSDNRYGSYQSFGQRLTIDGVALWGGGGAQFTSGDWDATSHVVHADGFGGAIVSWIDYRNGRSDIFSQRLEPGHGEWGRPEPIIASSIDNPGDQGGFVKLEWYRSDRDQQPYTLIAYYSTWRATDSPFFGVSTVAGKDGDALSTAVHSAKETWPGAAIVTNPSTVASDFEGQAIWVQERPQAVPMFWEWMSNQTASYQSGYSYLAPTRSDSSGAGPATHYFKVVAHTWEQFTFWESQYSMGYSVDNLAPGAPLMLSARRVGNYVQLDWNPSGLDEPDFSEYIIYRATSSGVTPVPLYLLDNTTELTLWDRNAPAGTPYFYIVTARDVHGNQSVPSNEANIEAVASGTGDSVPVPSALQVLSNVPNPFSGATTLRIGLPGEADVILDVFDVAGRLVHTRSYPQLSRGWSELVFDGRDDAGRSLPGGVYFYQVRAGGAIVTQKMVLTR